MTENKEENEANTEERNIELGIYPTQGGIAFDLTNGVDPFILTPDDVGRVIINLVTASVMFSLQKAASKANDTEQIERVRRLIETGKNIDEK